MSPKATKELNTNIWTDINIQRYLQLYLNSSVLWDEMRCDFSNQESRAAAHEKIAKKLQLRGVGPRDCRKLIKQLKIIYAQRYQRPDDLPPKWYDLMADILKRISCTKGRDRCLCEGYRPCNLRCSRYPESACSFYHTYRKCKKCCDRQCIEMACCAGAPSSRETLPELRIKRQMCLDCCAIQGIGPPCADFYDSDSGSCSDEAEEKQPDEKPVECPSFIPCTSKVEYVYVAVIKLDKQEEDDKLSCDSDCSCQVGASTECITDWCATGVKTRPPLVDCSDEPCVAGSCLCGNEDDEVHPDDHAKRNARVGPFMDSTPRRGKPISLVLAGSRTAIVKPRFAARPDERRNNDRGYQLQIDL